MTGTSPSCVLSRTQSDAANAMAMKETLLAQQQLLQKLYAELDQEREASATAASEALDMILRLQGEKAAVKMEASHYKRMAEEKIGHAEATLEAFEDLMYQKEMEIASLEFQVQAYKHKLLSMGCDFSASEFEFPEDLLNRNDSEKREIGIRRLRSMPPIQLKNSWRVARRRERSVSPGPVVDVIPKVSVEKDIEEEVTPQTLGLTRNSSGNLESYWNLIKKLDEKVKVISDCNEGEKCTNLRKVFSQAATKMAPEQSCRLDYINSDKVNGKEVAEPSSLLNVHDVFEVPQTSGKQTVAEFGKKWLEKLDSEAENRLRKPDSTSEGITESNAIHDTEKLNGMLNMHREIKTTGLRRMMTIIEQRKEGMAVDCNTQAELQKLHQRIERLERERISIRQEITHERDGEEQLRLLKGIESQLKQMQQEMSSWKTKLATPNPKDDYDDLSLRTLQEAMLHFWL